MFWISCNHSCSGQYSPRLQWIFRIFWIFECFEYLAISCSGLAITGWPLSHYCFEYLAIIEVFVAIIRALVNIVRGCTKHFEYFKYLEYLDVFVFSFAFIGGSCEYCPRLPPSVLIRKQHFKERQRHKRGTQETNLSNRTERLSNKKKV